MANLSPEGWINLVFWVVVIYAIAVNPLDLAIGKWWVYPIVGFIGLAGLVFITTTLEFLGKIVSLIEMKFEKQRRNELRYYFLANTDRFIDGVKMEGRWKDIYDLLDFRFRQKYAGIEAKRAENGEWVEYPIKKWRLIEESEEFGPFPEPDWDFIEVPSKTQTIWRGFLVLLVTLIGTGMLVSINESLNR